MNPEPVVDTIAPLFQFLFGVGLLVLIGWLLGRVFRATRRHDDVQQLLDERRDRARPTVRDC